MTQADGPSRSFVCGWDTNYVEMDSAELKNRIRCEWKRDLLTTDYHQAAASGNHRNQLLHHSFYVGLVLLGVIFTAALMIAQENSWWALSPLLGVGASIYYILYRWSVSAKAARDAAWDRQSEIEDMVKQIDTDVLRSNDSIFKRLTRDPERRGRYFVGGKSKEDSVSVGELIISFNLYLWLILMNFGAIVFIGWLADLLA